MASGYTQYANFSLWDIYRSEVQLLALLAPQQTSDMVTSLLADAAQGGGLPKWPVANLEAAQLNGDSADAFIASAYAFGARDFDVPEALADMVKGSDRPRPSTTDGHLERQDLAQYLAKGYVQADAFDLTSLPYTVGGSETLEYAIDDFAISQLAQAAGDAATSQTFLARAQNWQNLVNPATGYLAGRRADGTFPPGPAFQRSPDAGHRPGRVRRGQRHPVHLERPPEPAGPLRRHRRQRRGGGQARTRSSPSSTPVASSPMTGPATSRRSASPWEYDYAGAPWRTQDVVQAHRHHAVRADAQRGAGQRRSGGDVVVVRVGGHGPVPRDPGAGRARARQPALPPRHHDARQRRAIVIDAPGASPATPYVQSLDVAGVDPSDGGCSRSPGAGAAPAPSSRLRTRVPWLPATVWETGAAARLHPGPASPDTAWGRGALRRTPVVPGPAERGGPAVVAQAVDIVYTMDHCWQRGGNEDAVTSSPEMRSHDGSDPVGTAP